jgi:hypothetical protein
LTGDHDFRIFGPYGYTLAPEEVVMKKTPKKGTIRDVTAKSPQKVKGGMVRSLPRAPIMRLPGAGANPCTTSCSHATHVLADDEPVC